MAKWRRRRRLGLAAVALALAWGLYAGFEGWRVRRGMAGAQAEIAAGRWEPARRRLAECSIAISPAIANAATAAPYIVPQ